MPRHPTVRALPRGAHKEMSRAPAHRRSQGAKLKGDPIEVRAGEKEWAHATTSLSAFVSKGRAEMMTWLCPLLSVLSSRPSVIET